MEKPIAECRECGGTRRIEMVVQDVKTGQVEKRSVPCPTCSPVAATKRQGYLTK